MSINLTEAACKLIAKEGTDATFGARPLRRAIQRLLEDPLSEQILEGTWTSGSVIDVDAVDGELVFTAGSAPSRRPASATTSRREAELLLTNYDLGRRRQFRRLVLGRRRPTKLRLLSAPAPRLEIRSPRSRGFLCSALAFVVY